MLNIRRLIVWVPIAIVFAWWLARSPAQLVEVASVWRGPLLVRVTTNGKVEPIEDVEVRARLDGRIEEIPEPGAWVEEGEVVLRIDASAVSAGLAAARSERLAAQESLRSARDELAVIQERAATDQRLFEQGATTRGRNAESQAALNEARARVEFLEREVPLRVASLDLRIQELSTQEESAVVRAAFSGTVYRTERRLGEMLRVGDPVLRLADLSQLRVRANIDQVDLGRVKAGQSVRITSNAYPNQSWSAFVSEVIPHVVVRESRSISEGIARVEPPTAGLVPGMNVDVEIVVDEASDALQIPAEAIFTENGGTFVYLVTDSWVRGSRAYRTPVTLGRATVASLEVVAGLQPDDIVAVGPVGDLADGGRVEVRSGERAER